MRATGWKMRSTFVRQFVRWQLLVTGEMIRPQWFADGVLAVEPFAEINQPATLRAEGAELAVEPRAAPPACRTLHLAQVRHRQSRPSFLSFGGMVARQYGWRGSFWK